MGEGTKPAHQATLLPADTAGPDCRGVPDWLQEGYAIIVDNLDDFKR